MPSGPTWVCARLDSWWVCRRETAAAASYARRLVKDKDSGKPLDGTIQKMNAMVKHYEESSRPYFCAKKGFVDEVVRFDDTEVSMRTSRGMLTVHGEGLRVGRLAIDTGELAIDGAFDALDYTEETASGGGFWSRLFGG